MRYRILDENGDMRFGNQQADFYRDSPEAVAQAIMTRLRLWVGEWFVDLTSGTPYQQGALGTGKRQTIEPMLRRRILETEGVSGIVRFEMNIDADARIASISAMVNTIYSAEPVLVEGAI